MDELDRKLQAYVTQVQTPPPLSQAYLEARLNSPAGKAGHDLAAGHWVYPIRPGRLSESMGDGPGLGGAAFQGILGLGIISRLLPLGIAAWRRGAMADQRTAC